MDLKEFKDFYTANKDNSELKSFMGDEFQNYASSDDGLKFLQPVLDSHGSKVVEAYKGKGMQTELESARADERKKAELKYNPIKTPLEQKFADLEAKYNQSEADRGKEETKRLHLEMKGKASKDLTFPSSEELLRVFQGEDGVKTNVELINKVVQSIVDSELEAKLKLGKRTPGGNSDNTGTVHFTHAQVAAMSEAEINTNYEKIQESQKHW